VPELQDRDGSHETATKQFLIFLNIIRLSNKDSLTEYWDSCFTELSKFMYVH